MTLLRDADFGLKLCKILKLDTGKTQNIRIINNVNDVVRVEVDQVLRIDESKKILKVLEKYELHLIDIKEQKL